MDATIRPGDIVLMEKNGKSDWLGFCIEKLTHSKVTHAAMVYEEDFLIEMTQDRIRKSRFQVVPNGRKAYFMRLNKDINPAPLLADGKQYLDEKPTYAYAEVVYLAILLLTRYILPTKGLADACDVFFGHALNIGRTISKKSGTSKRPKHMMCSQLVYQIFADCGPEYQIDIENQQVSEPFENSVRLCDYVTDIPVPNSTDALSETDLQDIDGSLKDLYSALTSENYISEEEFRSEVQSGPLGAKGQSFVSFLQGLVAELVTDSKDIDVTNPSLYITPEDMLHHAHNLTLYKEAYILEKD